MLHITDGESVAGTLEESGLPGEVLVDGDLLYEVPPPWSRERPASNPLVNFTAHEETILWFDHRLSNQLLLIRALDWFSRQDLTGRRLSIVFAGSRILGGLTAAQLAALAPARVPANAAHFETARTASDAFAAPDPTAIERVLATDTSALPFLGPALLRYLEEFPATGDGLSRTQRQALSVLRDQGPQSAKRLFFAVQQLEETAFMGDLSFFNILAAIASAREPLVQGRLLTVAINDAGIRVLEGRADHLRLNGIESAWGRGSWRWDRSSRRLVSADSENAS
jgi:hypothetical protein